MLGLPVSGFGTVDFEGVPVDVPAEFGDVPNEAIRQAAPLADAGLGARVTAQVVEIAARFAGHFAEKSKQAMLF
jgi:creatinine amidohydrolase